MRSFNEHVKETEELRKELMFLNKRKEELTSKIRTICKDFSYVKEHMSEYERYHEEEEKLSGEILDTTIKLRLMENNARIALFHEVMPVAIDIMKKWKGKPYGDKTKDKIRQEMVEKTGCSLYISQSRISIIHIKHAGVDIDVMANGDKKFLQDNKVQEVSMDDLSIAYINNTYFEDLESAAQKLKDLHAEAIVKQKEFEWVCSKYNKLCVEGIKEINSRGCIYGII